MTNYLVLFSHVLPVSLRNRTYMYIFLSVCQRRSQDFCLGGHPVHFPSSLREPTAFSGGGGVVAEMLRDLLYRIRFSEGGGL